MFYKKNCISDRHYIIRYPTFSPRENAKKKEIRAVFQMNGFYETLKTEIIAYCTEFSAGHPKAMYLADAECTARDENGEKMLDDGDEISLHSPVTVRVALVLRNRPDSSKRLSLVHVWLDGYLVK